MKYSNDASSRVLVTGGSGFVGQYCLQELAEKGIETHGLGRGVRPVHWQGAWHSLDLHDHQAMKRLIHELRPSHLLHLAWYTQPGKYLHALENLNWVQSSLALFMAFQQAGGKRILGVGSCLEYDLCAGYCSEFTSPRQAAHLYGRSKHALRLMGEALGQQCGLDFAWAHLFYLYGPGEAPNRLVPSVFQSILAGTPVKCSHGRQIKDFLHVQDVASALVTLLLSSMQGPVNIASGQPISIRQLVTTQLEVSGRDIALDFGAYPVSPFDPLFIVANTQRLQEELGWKPSIDLASGLKQMYLAKAMEYQ